MKNASTQPLALEKSWLAHKHPCCYFIEQTSDRIILPYWFSTLLLVVAHHCRQFYYFEDQAPWDSRWRKTIRVKVCSSDRHSMKQRTRWAIWRNLCDWASSWNYPYDIREEEINLWKSIIWCQKSNNAFWVAYLVDFQCICQILCFLISNFILIQVQCR